MSNGSSTAVAHNVDPFTGFVLGMAVGDSLGLSREGISARRGARIFGVPPLRQNLVCGRGMVSDDTEHMRMTAVALLQEPQNAARFARSLAWKLRWWLLALPGGTGMATARAVVRLWLGCSPERSGVYSAGNGPAMRAGIIGLCLHRDSDSLREFVRAATRITHVDPRAEIGALLIALAAQEVVRSQGRPIDPSQFLSNCRAEAIDPEWIRMLDAVEQSLSASETATQFAARIQCSRGITGYIPHTVGTVLFCWLRWPGEFRQPVEQVILLGGDTDTTAALLGGLAGATCGESAIPAEWLNRLIEWPYTVSWMRGVLANALQRQWGNFASELDRPDAFQISPPVPRPVLWLAVLARNVMFLLIVLTHGFRRLLPPY